MILWEVLLAFVAVLEILFGAAKFFAAAILDKGPPPLVDFDA